MVSHNRACLIEKEHALFLLRSTCYNFGIDVNVVESDKMVYDRKVKAFRMARYVMITPNPENDVNAYMDNWAQQSGLLEFQPDAMRIGWDFPFVSSELKNRFGLWGYVAAYILPKGFETCCPGVKYEKEGVTCMDVYIHVDSVSKTDCFTNFS